MATKSNVKPETSSWTIQRAKQNKAKYNHKFDIGDLVVKYPGKVWEVIDLGYDDKKNARTYNLRREVGGTVQRWKSCWVTEAMISGAFIS